MSTLSPYTGDGSTTQWDITFSYGDASTVKATVDGVAAPFTFVNSSRIEFDSAPAAGAEIRIYRETPVALPDVDFTDGAIVRANDLDAAVAQSRNRAEEIGDQLSDIYTRSLKVPQGEEGITLPRIAERLGKLLGFDAGTGELVLSDGSGGLVNIALLTFLQEGVDAVSRSLLAKMQEFKSVKDYGAVGDGIADDHAAIQALLTHLGAGNGGTVLLPKTDGFYRITDTLRVPSNVTLLGVAPMRYPYVSGNGHSGLVADFTDPNKWVVETATTNGGSPYAYDAVVSGDLPDGYVVNVGIKNLIIRSQNTVPYGGIRIHGAPGSVVENVGITGVGTGILINYSFGCTIQVHTIPLYYGLVAWNDVNACSLNVYATQDASLPTTVPAAYQLSFMADLDGTLVGAYAMHEEHSARPFGVIIGATTGSLSVNNDLRLVGEAFKGGLFMFNARGVEVTRAYLEGTAMEYGVAAANATFAIRGLHAFMDGVGALFDMGAGIKGSLSPGGLVTPASFGTGPYGLDGSLLVVHNASPDDSLLAPSSPSTEIIHPDIPGAWVNPPAAASGWTNSGTYPPAYRINGSRIELRGFATGGSTGTTVWTLPAGYRPAVLHNLGGGFGAQVAIGSDGTIQLGSGTVLGLDGVSFPRT